MVHDALLAAGTSVQEVGATALANGGVLYAGLATLGAGSVLVGMVLGTIAVFIIDRRFVLAAAGCGVGGVLTLIGLIHGEEVHVFSNPRLALGYGLAAVVCLGYAALRLPPREVDPLDPVDLEVAAERERRALRARGGKGGCPRLTIGGCPQRKSARRAVPLESMSAALSDILGTPQTLSRKERAAKTVDTALRGGILAGAVGAIAWLAATVLSGTIFLVLIAVTVLAVVYTVDARATRPVSASGA